MKSMHRYLLGLAIISAAGARAYGAAEPDVTGSVGLSVGSAYVWRGLEISPKPVIQPEASVRASDFSVNFWGSWDFDTDPNRPTTPRFDVSADYGFVWNSLLIRLGILSHFFPGAATGEPADTYEAYVDLAADVPLHPSLTVYHDFDEFGGVYACFGLNENWSINTWADAIVEGSVGTASSGFNGSFFRSIPGGEGAGIAATEKDALVDAVLGLSFPMTFHKLVVTPKAEYVTLIDKDLRDAVRSMDRKSDRFIVSLRMAMEF